MDREWNDSQPIYRQIRDRVVAMILDGVLQEGDPLPSVRNVAGEYRVNRLAVLKGYQELVDEQFVRVSEVAACSSIGARAICCCRPNARSFSRNNGPGSTQPFSGSDWRRKNCAIASRSDSHAAFIQCFAQEETSRS